MKKYGSIAVILILLLLNISDIIDDAGHEYFNKAIKNAGTTYLIARGINGVISVIQDGEIMVSPAGVGASISPGEILDPLNDLIEQFSDIMLLATASLGIQKLLLVFSAWWLFKSAVLLSLIAVLAGFFLKSRHFASKLNNPIFYKILIILLSIRFIIPFIVVSNGIFESIFLSDRLNDKIEKIQLVENLAAEIDGNEEEGWFRNLVNKTQIKEKTTLIKEKLSNSVDNIIDLIALFMIQTVLFPISFLYLALKLAKFLFVYDFSQAMLGNPRGTFRETDLR